MRYLFAGVLLATLIGLAPPSQSQIYRWVDQEGNVHYSDCPPTDCEYEEQAEADVPSEAQRQEAERIAKETRSLAESLSDSAGAPGEEASSGRRHLSTPESVSSKYLRCTGAYWQAKIGDGFKAVASIALIVDEDARRDGVYVEAEFPNPGSGGPFHAGAHASPGQSLVLRSSHSAAYDCDTRYAIRVRVYPSHRKLRLIDQLVQPSVIPHELCDLFGAPPPS